MMHISVGQLEVVLKLINFKYWIEKALKHPARSTKPLFTKAFTSEFYFSECRILNCAVYTMVPKHTFGNKHVIFFHGGAYVFKGSAMHRKLLEYVAIKCKCAVSYIDYPLAPENTFRQTFEMIQLSYDKLLELYPQDQFMLMGDSAGGGLALAFAQLLSEQKANLQPVKLILFSPWLDLSLKNPAIKQMESVDKVLPLNGLLYAAKKYAGEDSLIDHYLVSPINGQFDFQAETMIFYGTNEIFYPDCKILKEKTQNGNFIFHEFAGMPHDWVILPLKEATEALDIAIHFIKK